MDRWGGRAVLGLGFGVGLLLGLWAGVIVGVLMGCLLAAARRRDDEDERVWRLGRGSRSAEIRRAQQRHPSVPQARVGKRG